MGGLEYQIKPEFLFEDNFKHLKAEEVFDVIADTLEHGFNSWAGFVVDSEVFICAAWGDHQDDSRGAFLDWKVAVGKRVEPCSESGSEGTDILLGLIYTRWSTCVDDKP